ncbi:endonuclease [Formosa maritima]|uniref:T9SS type A sorting domain-containing protein n=1 Tax=Formosa maritima TaxID=2592046 RepID=A0A5D0GBA7_9FLAO|nr:endonuclease [Formosa maritima]TYA55950.1 T9SS type A sorting domain-containing protein [Formosa maritima]
MKHFYTLLLLLISAATFAQIPVGYYNSATGTGYTLKTQLHNIIDDHNDQGYNAMDGFIATYDRDNYYDSNGSNTILDIYSEIPNNGNNTPNDPYNFIPITDECGNYSSEGDCYNKEHVIPKSVFNDQTPMYSDAHELLPTDGRVNGFRGNEPFGVVDDAQLDPNEQNGITNPTQNGSKLGNNLNSGYSAGYTGKVFEPIDEFKGDIARIYFYFATRYEDQVSAWGGFAMFNGTSDQVFDNTFLSILMTWHEMDPVSEKEMDRNNNIYYHHQGNRNPFVDHPEWVALIWNPTPDTEAPTNPANLVASNPTDNTISLAWTASTDNIAVTSYDIYVDGTNSFNSTTNSFTVTGLTADTNYCFTIKAKDATGNESGFSNESCEMTTDNGTGNSVEIFFTEYMEGSSNNKALEISNWSFSPVVDLSVYTIKLSSNGSPTWTATYNFPTNATINYGETFVIANGSLAVCTNVVDDFNNTITSFNGNDAIGLFKNDVLIDIIGTLGDATVFGENVTLVKSPSWYPTPSTTFNINDWVSYPSNTCSDLGHTILILSTDNFTSEDFNIYPNPVSDILNIQLKNPNETQIEIYNILGKRVLTKTINQSQIINIENLNSGIYILKFTQGNSTISKKLIKK